MVVGIDARAYSWTGIGRYARNLLVHLARQPSPCTFVVFLPPRFAREVAALPRMRVVPVRDSYYSLWEQTGFLARLLSVRSDLLHFLSFNAPVLTPRPSIVTIHDLTRFTFPGAKHRDVLHQWAYRLTFRRAVHRARRIITVSETTAAELTKVFPDTAEKTVVIPEGVEPIFGESGDHGNDARILSHLGVDAPYLLYVGLWLTHKNVPVLLRAFADLRTRGYPGTLVITGEGRPWEEDLPRLAARIGIVDAVRFPGHVTDGDLAALYRHADVFLFPSRSEGFGLPPLEALAAGTPVVAARAGSLPEVLGDAALYADPDDPGAFARAVELLRADPSLRARLVAAGQSRVRRSSWEDCAAETLRVYAEALGPARRSPRVKRGEGGSSATLTPGVHEVSRRDSVQETRPSARPSGERISPHGHLRRCVPPRRSGGHPAARGTPPHRPCGHAPGASPG